MFICRDFCLEIKTDIFESAAEFGYGLWFHPNIPLE